MGNTDFGSVKYFVFRDIPCTICEPVASHLGMRKGKGKFRMRCHIWLKSGLGRDVRGGKTPPFENFFFSQGGIYVKWCNNFHHFNCSSYRMPLCVHLQLFVIPVSSLKILVGVGGGNTPCSPFPPAPPPSSGFATGHY